MYKLHDIKGIYEESNTTIVLDFPVALRLLVHLKLHLEKENTCDFIVLQFRGTFQYLFSTGEKAISFTYLNVMICF